MGDCRALGDVALSIDEWERFLKRFGYRVDAVIGNDAVRLRDCRGDVHRFSPHPAKLKPAELAMLTRDFLFTRGHELGADETAA